MGRILAIDYGKKRTGIAVTDVLQLIANGLTTVPTNELQAFLVDYVKWSLSHPSPKGNEDSDNMKNISPFVKSLSAKMNIPIEFFDERFTSVIAQRAMIDGGLKKKARQNKALVDEISATIILQSYLESLKFRH